MKKHYLSLQRNKENIGYVVVNIYKPYDKLFSKEEIPNVIDVYMQKDVFKKCYYCKSKKLEYLWNEWSIVWKRYYKIYRCLMCGKHISEGLIN